VLSTLLSLTDAGEESRGHLAVLISEACANAVMHADPDSTVDITIVIDDRDCLIQVGNRGSNPDGDPTWPKQVGGATMFPYFRHGTAGIVAVAARFHACTGDARYRHSVRGAEADLMRRHAISPGLFDGLTGIGETLLDLAGIFPDSATSYFAAARHIARGIEPFLVQRDEGLAVPGVELLRLSCDFATGNAGVGAFYDRLHRGGAASFMLDEHLSLAAWKPHANAMA